MNTSNDLRNLLERIDHRGYPAYKDTAGAYQFRGYVLSIDHVQGDPFASPSDVSVHVSGKTAGFPEDYVSKNHRRVSLEDLLTRSFGREAGKFSFQAKGSGKSGLIQTSRPGQEVLERSACHIGADGGVVFRFNVGFPANGRTINSRELIKILFDFLPQCVEKSLYYKSYAPKEVQELMNLADDRLYIRSELARQGLVAFVADGAILPRESGVSQKPMKGAVAFKSPDSLAVTLELPHAGVKRGMGIPKGIKMICGGGYHGKSTLLKALELGVYDHIAGDGREYVITDDTAVKLRAEDGRSVSGVDISMFIRNLPNGKNTVNFFTEDASGSTSQAANVVEAMEAGSKVFLIDEDTSATNFMIRDELMQLVINRESEPIIPFIDRVEELYSDFGISTVLVAGSCGSYFNKADCIIQMKQYQPIDITQMAKKEAAAYYEAGNCGDNGGKAKSTAEPAKTPNYARYLRCTQKLGDRVKTKSMGLDGISIDKENIDLRYVEQIADSEQVSMLGPIVRYAIEHLIDGRHTMTQVVDQIMKVLEQKGMQGIYGGRYQPAGYAMLRRQEIAACLNRYRRLAATK
ncbi:MAG: ABC-ATPase domain-containing protein [Clostridiales bacterium]|nr:ABC-ATPase domain-containing protein [Clostridiales bacterium]